MYARALVLAAFVAVFALVMSACGGSGQKLYDAQATYSCLRQRPEFRSTATDPYGLRPHRAGFTFTSPRPRRFDGSLDYGTVIQGVSGYELTVRWNPEGRGYLGSFFDTGIDVFDSVRDQRKLIRTLSSSSFLKADLKNTTIRRNAVIYWGLAQVPKAPTSVVLGCLRTT